jgi:hypothetical protein
MAYDKERHKGMSQPATAGQRARRGGGRKRRYFTQGGIVETGVKPYKSGITEITQDTFNMGRNKVALQFTHSHKNVANYLQHNSAAEGYLFAQMVRTGQKQTIDLPPSIDPNAPVAEDLNTIRVEEVKPVAKRRLKLEDTLKKVYAIVYDQCSQEVCDKLKAKEDWERTQKEQSLNELIQKIKGIYVGFDNHKQEMFDLVQVLKMLFLLTQSKKETDEYYGGTLEACGTLSRHLGDHLEYTKGS